MNKIERHLCREVLTIISGNPSYKILMSCIRNLCKDDTSEVIDADIIKTRIMNGQYNSISDFRKDLSWVHLVIKQYFANSELHIIVANEVSKKINKEINKRFYPSVSEWLSKIYILKKRVNHISGNPPESISSSVPSSILARKDLRPLSPQDFSDILRTINTIQSDKDKSYLNSLLNTPKCENDLIAVPLTNLRTAADYIKNLEKTTV